MKTNNLYDEIYEAVLNPYVAAALFTVTRGEFSAVGAVSAGSRGAARRRTRRRARPTRPAPTTLLTHDITLFTYKLRTDHHCTPLRHQYFQTARRRRGFNHIFHAKRRSTVSFRALFITS